MFTFGDFPCLDPKTLFQQCLERGLPVDRWYGKANYYQCPLGWQAGRGALLMRWGDLQQLGVVRRDSPPGTIGQAGDKFIPLVIGGDGDDDKITIAKMQIVSFCEAVTPGFDGDPNAAYLVEIADKRRLWQSQLSNQTSIGETIFGVRATSGEPYNMRSESAGAPFFTDTMDNTILPISWEDVVGEVAGPFGATELGSPFLPFTPDGTPEGFTYPPASPMVQAAQHILTRLACAIRYDPIGDNWDEFTGAGFIGLTSKIVRLGDATTPAAVRALQLIAVNKQYLLWDFYPAITRAAALPFGIRCAFRVKPAPPGGSSAWFLGADGDNTHPERAYFPVPDTAGTSINSTGINTPTMLVLEDDLAALYSPSLPSPSITNGTALFSRQTERATDWIRKRKYFDTDNVKIYQGIINLLPCVGELYQSVTWEDRGDGLKTILRAGSVDDRDLENWRRCTPTYDSTVMPPARYCIAFNSASLSIVNNTETAITLDSEDEDTDNFHSTSSNKSRITIGTGLGGIYLLVGRVKWNNNSTGERTLRIKKNATTILEEEHFAYGTSGAGPTYTLSQQVTRLVRLADADYVELYGLQTSGGALSVLFGASYSPYFSAHRISS